MKLFVCEQCDHQFHDDEGVGNPGAYIYDGQLFCEDCLVDMGILLENAISFELPEETGTEEK